MAFTFSKLATVTAGAGGTASMSFTNIPQNYKDLCIKLSTRTALAAGNIYDILNISFNRSASNISVRNLYGTGSVAGTDSGSANWVGYNQANGGTASTFDNMEFYFSNYTSSNYKSFTYDQVVENNATANIITLGGGLWSNVSTISSITFESANGVNFLQYSSATLYGVRAEV